MKPEIIAKFETYDGKRCVMWSDGLITSANGIGIAGVGAAKDPEMRKADLRAAWWVKENATYHAWHELPYVIKAVRKIARKGAATSEDFFRAVTKEINRIPKAEWEASRTKKNSRRKRSSRR